MDIPFKHMDSRTGQCRELRQRAYAVLGGEVQYRESQYLIRSLAQRVVMIEEMISRLESENTNGQKDGVIIQANNTLLGFYKILDSEK